MGSNTQASPPDSSPIILSHREIKPQKGKFLKLHTDRERVIIKFDHLLSVEQKKSLEDHGVLLHQYLHHDAYVATVPRQTYSQLIKKFSFHSSYPLLAIDKLSHALKNETYNPWTFQGGDILKIEISFFSDVTFQEAQKLLDRLGLVAEEDKGFLFSNKLTVLVNKEDIKALSHQPEVFFLSQSLSRKINNNQEAATISRVDILNQNPFQLTGRDIRLALWDGGEVEADHPDFNNRVSLMELSEPSRHASHVAGTIGASGMAYRSGIRDSPQGMAPEVLIYSYDYEGPIYNEKSQAYLDLDIHIDNNSWTNLVGWYRDSDRNWRWYDNGDAFGSYSDETRTMDLLAYSNPDVSIVKGAGNDRDDYTDRVHLHGDDEDLPANEHRDQHSNDGREFAGDFYDNIPPVSLAKNIITVGAVDDDGQMTSFSSWGPADDGRIKPDIVANGTSLHSTSVFQRQWSRSYDLQSGTSMATAVVSGTIALLQEFYLSRLNRLATSTEIKALLVQSADDIDDVLGPSYSYGYGLLNAESAIQLLLNHEDNPSFIIRSQMTHLGIDIYDLLIDEGNDTRSISLTLAWLDPAGQADSPAPDLINDLDIELRSPDGQVYYPWRLNANRPDQAALSDQKNATDNIEKIDFIHNEAVSKGRWQVRVRGTRVVDGIQNYVIVSSQALESIDSDGDGLDDNIERRLGLNSLLRDTDRDGLDDREEVYDFSTNPRFSDTDFDSLSDGDEVNHFGTDPLSSDTDGDSMKDGYELRHGYDPLVVDNPRFFNIHIHPPF